MKSPIVASVALVGLMAAAAPAVARDGPEVNVRHAVARMVVVVEDRADIAVEVEQGTSGLPAIKVTRRGDDIRIDGDLGRRDVRNCSTPDGMARTPGEGASVEVRNVGRVQMSDAPLILVRTPRDVEVEIENGAVFGAIGRGASSISLGQAGCGDWTVANTTGDLDLSVAGSGNVWAADSGRLSVSLAGSGDISSGATRSLEANIAGSGNVIASRVDGPVEANIAGSGDVLVRGDAKGPLAASIAGSGDVTVRGRVTSVNASILGSGNVNVGAVSGAVSRSIMGSGSVNVGP